jgi:hypothetical protein
MLPHIPDDLRVNEIFYPYASQRRAEMIGRGGRFVHYTNADAAMSIIRSGEIWMRLSSCMNDFSEVEHGLRCLYGAYRRQDCGGEFRRALEDVATGLADEIGALFGAWTPSFRFATYLTCISEHDDKEDRTGRLSMWRAYSGDDTGVAFVMRPSVFHTPSDALRAYTSPVAYLNEGYFAVALLTVANNIDREREFLRQQDRNVVKHHASAMLRLAVLCTKHPGFAEEKEWRIVYSPDLEKSNRISKEIVSIRGAP